MFFVLFCLFVLLCLRKGRYYQVGKQTDQVWGCCKGPEVTRCDLHKAFSSRVDKIKAWICTEGRDILDLLINQIMGMAERAVKDDFGI